MLKEKRTKEKKNHSTSKSAEQASNAMRIHNLEYAREIQKAQAKDNLLSYLSITEKTKSAIKREATEKRRNKAAIKRAEARRMAEEEMMELEKRVMVRVTYAELRQKEEKEMRFREKELRLKEKEQSRIVNEKDYAMIVDVDNNNNWMGSAIDARTVKDAISQLCNMLVCDESSSGCIKNKKMKKTFFKPSQRRITDRMQLWEDFSLC